MLSEFFDQSLEAEEPIGDILRFLGEELIIMRCFISQFVILVQLPACIGSGVKNKIEASPDGKGFLVLL